MIPLVAVNCQRLMALANGSLTAGRLAKRRLRLVGMEGVSRTTLAGGSPATTNHSLTPPPAGSGGDE